MSGRIINPTGYTLRPTGKWAPGAGYLIGLTAIVGLRRKRKEYEFTLDARNPLTWQDSSMACYVRPDRHGITDLGSIPEQLEPIVCRSSFEASFIVHDSACREHCLYFSGTFDGAYVKCEVNSDRAHRLLRDMVQAEGGSWVTAWAICRMVRRFGPRW